jgi:hypothetical protein
MPRAASAVKAQPIEQQRFGITIAAAKRGVAGAFKCGPKDTPENWREQLGEYLARGACNTSRLTVFRWGSQREEASAR